MKNIKKIINNVDETLLEHSFQDACSDKEFYNYLNSLHIEESVLKKYTSNLEDSFIEHKNCFNCKSLDQCKNTVRGYCYTPVKDGNIITFNYFGCKKLMDKLESDAYKRNLDLFDMPKDIMDASFKNMYKDEKARLPIIKYFKEFIKNYDNEEKPKGLYLTGSFGSGKTYLIAALFNEMAKKNVQCVLIYYPEFLRSLKSSFQTNYEDKFNCIKKADLLLLDDIGAENCSNWSRDEVLGPILQYRMESHLPTFFTSNLTIEELETALSVTSSGVDKLKARRIVERIKQLTVSLELISKNKRN